MTITQALSYEYLSGLLDGEGTITLSKKGQRYSPRVSIAQSNQSYLEIIQDFMGGVGGVYHQKGSGCWSWVVAAKADVVSVLDKLEPFLILKRSQSILVREFIDLSYGIGYGQAYSDRMIYIISHIRELNRKPSLSTNFVIK